MKARLDQIVVDCREPASLARFWAALLGGAPVDRSSGWSHVEAPDFPKLAFQPVPEPKVAKNRLHLDVVVESGGIPAATVEAESLGARRVGSIVTDQAGSFQVMVDPEGNEFCFVGD